LFDVSQLVLNIMTTNIIKFTPVNSAHSHLVIEYKYTTIEEAAGTVQNFWVYVLIITRIGNNILIRCFQN